MTKGALGKAEEKGPTWFQLFDLFDYFGGLPPFVVQRALPPRERKTLTWASLLALQAVGAGLAYSEQGVCLLRIKKGLTPLGPALLKVKRASGLLSHQNLPTAALVFWVSIGLASRSAFDVGLPELYIYPLVIEW